MIRGRCLSVYLSTTSSYLLSSSQLKTPHGSTPVLFSFRNQATRS